MTEQQKQRAIEILSGLVRIHVDAKQSRTNPNVMFVDARDLNAYASDATELLKAFRIAQEAAR